jgi:hypothetical protein
MLALVGAGKFLIISIVNVKILFTSLIAVLEII